MTQQFKIARYSRGGVSDRRHEVVPGGQLVIAAFARATQAPSEQQRVSIHSTNCRGRRNGQPLHGRRPVKKDCAVRPEAVGVSV